MAWGIGVNTQWAVLKYESPMKSLNNIKSIIVNLPRIVPASRLWLGLRTKNMKMMDVDNLFMWRTL